jgi:hypothetical protein
MHRIELTGLPVGEMEHPQRADLEAVVLQVRNDVAGFAGLDCIGLDDG